MKKNKHKHKQHKHTQIAVIAECKREMKLLIKEIEARDKEIEEWKKQNQGASISKSLRTKPFSDNNFSTSCLDSRVCNFHFIYFNNFYLIFIFYFFFFKKKTKRLLNH